MTSVSAITEVTSRSIWPSASPMLTITSANSPAWASASEQSTPMRQP